MSERTCPVCGRSFWPRTGAHTYCTPVCRARARSVGKFARYGAQHRDLPAKLAPAVASGGVSCARCGRPIMPGEPWHLDHVDSGNGYLGASHAYCNTTTAGGAAARERALAVDDPERGAYFGPPDERGYQRPWSRSWYSWR